MRRFVAVAAVASVAAIATGVEPAAAAEPDFPAGIACTFPLDLDAVDNRKVHEFTDANGNDVQLITGLAGPVTLTNTDTGASLGGVARGAAWELATTPDGRTTTLRRRAILCRSCSRRTFRRGRRPPDTSAALSSPLTTSPGCSRSGNPGHGHGSLRGAVRLTPGVHLGEHVTVSPGKHIR